MAIFASVHDCIMALRHPDSTGSHVTFAMKRLTVLFLCVMMTTACNEQEDSEGPNIASNRSEDFWEPGADWILAWADEFDGDGLNESNWNRQVEPAGRFNEEWQRYTDSPENAYVEGGLLVIKAEHVEDGHGMDHYTSARINTAGKHAWTYGKIAARVQLPFGMGMWPAFWTLGANIDENGGDTPWPFVGEIDVLEFYGSKDDGAIEANLHYADATGSHAMMGVRKYSLEAGRFADAFHVFEIEWNEREIIWRVDGQEFTREAIDTDERTEFHHDHFLLLNMAVGGTWAGRPDDSTVFPQYMLVDWVRVYQR